jgi:hypothetical protein
MAYFNHAFSKRFLGTGATITVSPTPTPTNPSTSEGYLITPGVTSAYLSTMGPGYFGLFNANTYVSVNPDTTPVEGCCPLILASSSLYLKDKISPYIGGYQETNKSKYINPKYVRDFYRVDQCTPEQAIVSIGNTPTTGSGVLTVGTFVAGTAASWAPAGPYTILCVTTGGTGTGATLLVTVDAAETATSAVLVEAGINYTAGDVLTAVGGANDTTVTVSAVAPALDPNNFQGGTTSATCCFEFLCGETYYLRVDIKGSPTLRFLNHQSYHTVDAYTGCCVGPTPTVVDSTLVMISWAKELVNSDYTKSFILPVVFDETGVAWYAPGTTVDPITGAAVLTTQSWDYYVSPGHTASACAGLRLFGAYVETKFGNCSFQITDFFETEPVRIYASLVDYNGDPCVFEGICVYNDCRGVQGMGFGEQVLRDLIMSESYLQNFFHTDIRIREITQGSDILSAVNRNALYTRYYILHSVPRFNNPSGTFDNDQYMLEVITNDRIRAFEDDMSTWLDDCGNGCSTLKTYDCVHCEVVNN